ncbi:hypothetical protein CAPTEDRAFT_26888, partial [Capitella teleta]
ISFCSELKQKTQVIHDKSDKLVNWKLAVALTDTKLYGAVLADFYYVFKTIEDCVQRCGHVQHPIISPLADATVGLHRAEAFEQDVSFYLGSDWRGHVQPSLPAKEYCDRIMEISEKTPILLIAYVHSMYLAILAGGQIIKKIIRRSLGLVGNDGLAIFEFSESEESRLKLKKILMDCINQLPLDREEKEEILVEKRRVFAMNNAIANNVQPTAKSFSRIIKIVLIIIIVFLIIGTVIM